MKIITAGLLSLVFTVTILLIHMTPNVNSMLNEYTSNLHEGYLLEVVEYHKTGQPAFAKRPLTTWLIESCARLASISVGKAFVYVNFTLLFCSGCLIWALSMVKKGDFLYALGNMVTYFLCFSVLFMFFPPVYSYDEPLQYCLIILSLWALNKKQWLGFIIVFTLAIIARESSMLLIPGLFLLLSADHKLFDLKFYFTTSNIRKLLLLIIPVVAYALFLFFYARLTHIQDSLNDDLSGRLDHFFGNFRNRLFTIETITSFILINAVPIVLLSSISLENKQKYRKYINAFMVTLVINTAVVLLATKAREVRLFALPLFFIWPLFFQMFQSKLRIFLNWNLYVTIIKKPVYLVVLILLVTLVYFYSFGWYAPSIGMPNENYFNEYLFVMLTSICLFYLLRQAAKTAN